MNINDLNIEYDKLQQEYGAKELASIYNDAWVQLKNQLIHGL